MDLIATCIDPELDNPSSPNQYIEDIESSNLTQLQDRYFAGLDLGKQIDYSVLAVVQITEKTSSDWFASASSRLVHLIPR